MTEPRPYLTERRPCTWCEEIAAFAILWDLYEPPDYACAFHAGRWERAGLRFRRQRLQILNGPSYRVTAPTTDQRKQL